MVVIMKMNNKTRCHEVYLYDYNVTVCSALNRISY